MDPTKPQAAPKKSDSELAWYWIWRLGISTLLLTALGMAGCPAYNVWTAKMQGEATLAHANQARQVIVAQAEAELDAAQKRAKAIEIVGEMAKRYPEYRQQEFIGAFGEALKEGKITQIIYVPTEANIPILEADGRRHSP